ncbi:uncharacterized protein LOC132184880 isoform X2 [Corylus avellana]|uniref:uncharacterized protein LOC132184880 isoform X2 n=1 Tax=Corylus avellana TaxID=13451 RepID=UPI00286C6BA4|nr:uncharacterized protein LOC132184880 isoform X2 [Corylus avellana]
MGRLRTKSDYEDLRSARILENQARLASLGLQKTVSELRSIASSAKPAKAHVREYNKKDYKITPLRRSDRLKQTTATAADADVTPKQISRRRSARLRGKEEESEERSRSWGRVKASGLELQLSPEDSARRCKSKGRGNVYNPVFGICCHFCRQKTLCVEEDCKRCGNFDMDQPCIGKTDCSVCHSSYGVLCRACLKVRYGEEMEEVRKDKEWMCPHCAEETGFNPYWICNSSMCLRKRKMPPTGLAIYRAREMGYKSVAHLLMDELLQRANKSRR